MIPDFEQRLDGRMKQASLKELMPDFDKEAEWLLLSARLAPAPQKKSATGWWRAAAIITLIAGSSWLAWVIQHEQTNAGFAQQTPTQGDNAAFSASSFSTYFKAGESGALPVDAAMQKVRGELASIATTPVASVKKERSIGREIGLARTVKVSTPYRNNKAENAHVEQPGFSSKGYICNSTPCPIQICITQTMKCKDVAPAAISTCSILEPDQSGKLSYKAHDKVAKNCSLSVKEIEIKSIATGETIVLNSHSSPSTAQDVFSYITGQKKGDILAGVFTRDCDDRPNGTGIRIGNRSGDLILE